MVVLTVGVNTYVTRAEANAQLSESFVYAAPWTAQDGSSRDRALVEAFGMMERQRYKGTRTGGGAQAAQFPRDGITSCDGYDESGVSPAPVAVRRAQVLLAAAIVATLESTTIVVDSSVATSDGQASNIRRAQAGSASVEFFRAGTASGARGTRFPTAVQELLKCYILNSDGAFGSLSNGTGEDVECPDFGLSGGF
jgi:hypothetical protein